MAIKFQLPFRSVAHVIGASGPMRTVNVTRQIDDNLTFAPT
jgi:hypothetical protein